MGLLRAAAAGSAALACYQFNQLRVSQAQLPSAPLEVFENNLAGKKRAIVIGGGVVGISTAHALARRGMSVVVLDAAHTSSATPSSMCAAGGCQRASSQVTKDTWVSVMSSLFPTLASFVMDKEEIPTFPFFHISLGKTVFDPHFVRWITTFMRTSLMPSTADSHRQDTMLKFTDYSITKLFELVDGHRGLAKTLGVNTRGCLKLVYGAPPASPAAGSLEPEVIITRDEAIKLEPCVRKCYPQPKHVVYQPNAKAASSELFTHELAKICKEDPSLDVTFVSNCRVGDVQLGQGESNNAIASIHTTRGVIEANDAEVVVCAGAWTPHILNHCDVYAPVYPLKGNVFGIVCQCSCLAGYCIPFQAKESMSSSEIPSRIVCNSFLFASRLGEQVRVTSVGEFSGWNTTPTRGVDLRFRKEAKSFLPELSEQIDETPTRVGLRPYVNDGGVLLGRIPGFRNLSINCGPGSNGWKNCVGAAEIVALSLEGSVDGLGFDAACLSPEGRVGQSSLWSKLSLLYWHFRGDL